MVDGAPMGDDRVTVTPQVHPAGQVIAGRRLFGILPKRIELEIVEVIDTPQATHIRYRVRR